MTPESLGNEVTPVAQIGAITQPITNWLGGNDEEE